MLVKKVLLGVGIITLFAASVTIAFSASNVVAASKVMDRTIAVGMAEKKPPECDFWNPTTIVAGSGTFSATSAANLVLGSAIRDVIRAGSGDDCVLGGAGNDELRGENDNDILWGGSGSDTLIGGDTGFDVCIGGSGTDVFSGCEYTVQESP